MLQEIKPLAASAKSSERVWASLPCHQALGSLLATCTLHFLVFLSLSLSPPPSLTAFIITLSIAVNSAQFPLNCPLILACLQLSLMLSFLL